MDGIARVLGLGPRLALLVVVVVPLGIPAGAGASTVSLTSGAVTYVAGPGEANDLTIASPQPPSGQTPDWRIAVTDTGAVISPGAGCVLDADVHHATCSTPSPQPTQDVVNTGDGNDLIRAQG